MGLRTYQLTLGATPKRLSDVYGGAAGSQNPATDIPYRQVTLQASGAVASLGMDSAVTSAIYGYQLPIAGSITLGGGFDSGPIKLSDLWAVGAGSTLSILGIPF